VFRINVEENGALEAVVFSERRWCLFRSVFVVSGKEDDVLAFSGSGFAFKDKRFGAGKPRETQEGDEEFS
jgi:hypothetical protein